MNQIFSKTAFLQSQSGQGCRHLLKGELELYPVMPEWTTEETQTSLFK